MTQPVQEKELSANLMEPVHKFYRAYNDKNLEHWDEALSDAYVGHVNGADIPSREAGRGFVEAILAAFPDIQYTVEDAIVQGDKVTTRWSATGTHTGPLRAMPPTGKRIAMIGITIFHVVDGQIVELWNVWDQHGLIEQLTAD